jgi:hypothetical protein
MAGKETKRDWKWTPQRETAALSVAHDSLSDAEIAKEAGITRSTLSTWKHSPEFQGRIEEHKQAAREAIRKSGIALVENRVARKNADWERLETIRRARAKAAESDAELLEEGGATGLVLRRLKSIGTGAAAQIVNEYAIDTALLAERDRLEEAVARELGQRVEKHEVETRDVSIAEGLDAKIEGLAKRLAPTPATEPG